MRKLESDAELKEFSKNFSMYSGGELPFYYLRICIVYGAFRAGRMVGGFAVATGDNIRWVSVIKNPCPFVEQAGIKNLSEINGVWAIPEIAGEIDVKEIWHKLFDVVLSLDTPFITCATIAEKKGLIKRYRGVGKEIYRGPWEGRGDAVAFNINPMKLRLVRLRFVHLYTGRFFRKLFSKKQIPTSGSQTSDSPVRSLHPAASD